VKKLEIAINCEVFIGYLGDFQAFILMDGRLRHLV
jgi:hypothetical protein